MNSSFILFALIASFRINLISNSQLLPEVKGRPMKLAFHAVVPALLAAATICGAASAQVFDLSTNIISNGDFELGSVDGGQLNVADWYEGPNPFELIAVGDDGGTGLQSVGYDTNVDSNQFNPATWADWRSRYVTVTPGEKLLWRFRYKITNAPATPEGEILAETRGFASADVNGNPQSFVGTAGFEILIDTAGQWQSVEKQLDVPAGVTVMDLRFNQIFTLFTTAPWQGSFRLDDVAIYRELALRADFNSSLFVDGSDLAIWKSNFGTAAGATKATGDANVDGAVGGADYLEWQREFGLGTPPVAIAALAAVPEPAALAPVALLLSLPLLVGRHLRRKS